MQADVIDMNFVTNQPPQEIYEGQSFRVGLNIDNYATAKKDVFFCIFDELGGYFNGIPADTCQTVSLESAELSGDNIVPSKKRIYLPGEEETYVYNNIKGTVSTSIFAELNYQHKTTATSQICVKRDLETEVKDEKCNEKTQDTVENTDGPLRISNLEKTFVPLGKNKVSVLLKFDVGNVGSGKVKNRNAINNNNKENLDPIVDFTVNLLGKTKDFDCTPITNGKFSLKENQKTIKCQTTIDMEDSFQMIPLEISLNYGYSISKSTSSINIIGKGGGK